MGARLRRSYVSAIPIHVGQRELEVIGRALTWPQEQLLLRGLPNDVGPGNAVTITLEHEHVTEVFTGFGEKRVRAETVAGQAAAERVTIYRGAPVGEHLADQLLLPMALGDGVASSRHRPRRTCAPTSRSSSDSLRVESP